MKGIPILIAKNEAQLSEQLENAIAAMKTIEAEVRKDMRQSVLLGWIDAFVSVNNEIATKETA